MGVSSVEIRSVRELRAGDHIKWKRLAGYDHHAIVETVQQNRSNHQFDKVQVIEYSKPDGHFLGLEFGADDKLRICKPQIRQKDIYRCEMGTTYKYIYDRCYDAVTVLKNAKSRLGEKAYDLVKNNCEHFATWCKTGVERCSQVAPFVRRVVNCTAEGASGIGGKVYGSAVAAARRGTTIVSELTDLSWPTFKKTATTGCRAVGTNGLKSACSAAISFGASALFEGALFGYNCYKAQKNYKDAVRRVGNDKMTQQRLKKQRNQNIAEAGLEGFGAVAGTAIGAAIGSFVPVVGTVIGAFVGSIGGRLLGKLFGRWLHR